MPNEQLKIITPHELLISSQSLLVLSGPLLKFVENSRNWELSDYTQRAENFGAKLMCEPLRKVLSRARQQLENISPNDPQLQHIGMLAEPGRSEVYLQDYLTRRFPFQLLYAFLEQTRFTPEMRQELLTIQEKLAIAHHQLSFPTRVYGDRRKDHVPHAAILDRRLGRSTVYAQNQPELLQNVLERTKHIDSVEFRSRFIIRELQKDAAQYDVAGIELNLLALTTLLHDNSELLIQIIADALNAKNLRHPEFAFVQTVAISPGRQDYPNQSYAALKKGMDVVQEQEFKGSIIYAPGPKSNPELETKDLGGRFFNRNSANSTDG